MRRRTPILATLLALLALAALGAPAAPAAEDGSAWWQLLSGSRPTNLKVAPDTSETQELRHPDGLLGQR